MPGDNDLAELSHREARKQGVLDAWREERREDKEPFRSWDSSTDHIQSIEPGSVFSAKKIHGDVRFAVVDLHVYGRVPDDYEVKIILHRDTSTFEQYAPLAAGGNEIRELDLGPQLHPGDVLIVRLHSNDPEATEPIGPIIATIATSHA